MSKEGQQLVGEHVNAPPDAGSNMTRQQSLSTPSMLVQTDTEEHVRGKKALKKHLQRSIDKLVAAKEQLPEEEGREVAQGITDRIKALQLQKDGLVSVAARRKKALLKTLLLVAVEVGTTVKLPQTLALQTGVRVEETASCEGLTESRVPATPKQLPTVPEEEQDLLGTTPVGNSAEDVTNALNPFRSTSQRHRPY